MRSHLNWLNRSGIKFFSDKFKDKLDKKLTKI